MVVVEPTVARRATDEHLWESEHQDPIRVAVRGGVADGTLAARKQKKRIGVVVLTSTASGTKAETAADGSEARRPRAPLDGTRKPVQQFSDKMAELLAPKY